MSSEEDDDEELLQRALAEQAQRDLKYKMPSQYPASTVPPAAAGPPRRTPPQTPPKRAPPELPLVADDEDSDVELLSISSEDDDAFLPSRRGLGSAPKGTQRGRAKVTDREIDVDVDEEPESWNLVDQAEARVLLPLDLQKKLIS